MIVVAVGAMAAKGLRLRRQGLPTESVIVMSVSGLVSAGAVGFLVLGILSHRWIGYTLAAQCGVFGYLLTQTFLESVRREADWA